MNRIIDETGEVEAANEGEDRRKRLEEEETICELIFVHWAEKFERQVENRHIIAFNKSAKQRAHKPKLIDARRLQLAVFFEFAIVQKAKRA